MDRPLFPDDIVASTANDGQLAVILRTPDDVDTHTPLPGRTEQEPINMHESVSTAVFRRFMKDGIPPKGLVLVRWQHDPSLELIPVSRLKVLDRSLLIGDVVKRNVSDAMSGVILNTFCKCTLQPMSDLQLSGSKSLKGILPPAYSPTRDTSIRMTADESLEPLVDVPASDLKYVESLTEDDLVIYKDWIGRVEGIANNIIVRLTDNCVVEIADEVGEHMDSTLGTFCIGDVVKTKKGILRTGKWIFGQYNPNTPPVGTVVSVRTVNADITWLQRRIASPEDQEPNFVLEADELESPQFSVYDRTKRPLPIPSNGDITDHTISNSEIDVRLNLRVRFRDFDDACMRYRDASGTSQIPRLDRRDTLGYDLNVFDVRSFRTDVTVQWQDLSITTENSTELVPDGNIDDEHAVWPGEIAHSLDMHRLSPDLPGMEQPGRVGVIQAVNALERMATIRWCAKSHVHYSRDPDVEAAPANIVSQKIDSTDATDEDVSLYDLEAPAALNVRRGDIVLIGPPDFQPSTLHSGDIDWLGEIVGTVLNGNLIIRLGAAHAVRDVELTRERCVVVVRSDGTGGVDEWENEDDLAFGDSEDEDLDLSDGASGSDWDYDGLEGVEITYEDQDGNVLEEEDVEDEAWESEDEVDGAQDVEMTDPPVDPAQAPNPHGQQLADDAASKTLNQAHQIGQHPSDAPEAYMILDGEIPSSHHFHNEPSTTTSVHMKRTQKEHKILRNPSALPEGVYIRTWESRLDLLRVLLIGPTETPYANAPFVVDFYLPPSFPAEPPRAFFHSWLPVVSIGGVGRVNPNLYEDGTICLSILGTWDGNKSEGWNAARSTLLQVIVSLLGLVLVREPYFNEAGYEPLVGSEASKRPSALYSERIFLRAKGFLITAISTVSSIDPSPVAHGLEELEGILRWVYIAPNGPRLLDAVTKDVENVLERSEEGGEPNGLTLMSKGACIPLKRVLDRLRELHT